MSEGPLIATNEAAFDQTAVAAALRACCPTTRVAGLRQGPSGYSSRLWVADTDEGPLLVRIPVRDPDPDHLRTTMVATRLAAEADLPVVRYRAFAPVTSLGAPVLVQELRPGRRATDAVTARPELAASLGAAIGAWVGILHGITREAFGPVLAALGGSWPDVAMARVGRCLATLPAESLPVPADSIRRAFDKVAAGVSTAVVPSLVHGDLYLDNVLVNHNDEPVALLDFEHARFDDRFADFGKVNELLFEQHPDTRDPFLASYRDHFPVEADDDVRLRLGIGLYELGQLAYFHRWQPEHVSVYRTRLHAWLTAGEALV